MTGEWGPIQLARPWALWGLMGLPVLWLAFRLVGRSRRSRWRALGQTDPLPAVRAWAWVACAGCLVAALSQPRWGNRTGGELAAGHDIVLLIDVSRSMAAQDAFPSRLGAAMEAAVGLVRALGSRPGERAAVVAFAGRGVVACPLTENLGAVVEAIRSLRPGDVQPGGSDLAGGLATAVEALGLDQRERQGGRSLVLFSDGEDLAESWPDWLPFLRDRGIIVHGISLGDDENGSPIPWSTRAGQPEMIMHGGQVVISRRDDETLRRLALGTGGVLVPLGTATTDLGALYDRQIRPGEERAREGVVTASRAERFGLFVLAGVALAAGACLPARGRAPTPASAANRRARLAAVLLVGLVITGAAGPADWIAAGVRAYKAGLFEEALGEFERARAARPDSVVAAFDAGEALFQLGRYQEAAERYLAALPHAGPTMRARLEYALGNAAVATRDIPAAIAHYDACLEITGLDPRLKGLDDDARINREFAQNLSQPGMAPDEPPPQGGQEPEDPNSSDQGDDQGTGEGGDEPDEPDATPPASGGGASGDSPPSARGGDSESSGRSAGGRGSGDQSPESRLAEAVESIRRARESRIPDPPSISETAGDPERRDW